MSRKRVRWRISLDNTLPLFGAPISWGIYNNIITDEEKNYLHNLEMSRVNAGNGYQTTNKHVLDLPELSNLKDILTGYFLVYAHDVIGISRNVKFRMVTSWMNKHDKNDWAQQHLHSNSLFTGVLYTQVDENSGNIVFHSPLNNTNLIPSTIELEMDTWNIFNSKTWSLTTHNNQLVFFPATMLHSVTQNNSGIDRYSLAFNFFVEGTFGRTEETRLTL